MSWMVSNSRQISCKNQTYLLTTIGPKVTNMFKKNMFVVRVDPIQNNTVYICNNYTQSIQEGLAVASIVQDDPSTLPGDDPFPRARMHRDRNAR